MRQGASSEIAQQFFGISGAAFGLMLGQILFMVLLHIITKNINGGIKVFLKDSLLFLIAIFAAVFSFFVGNLFETYWIKIILNSLVFFLIFF